MPGDKQKTGGHTVEGTRIWCDKAPYDVTSEQAEVERYLRHSLEEPDASPLLHFTMMKNLLPCSLLVEKVSAIEPHIVR